MTYNDKSNSYITSSLVKEDENNISQSNNFNKDESSILIQKMGYSSGSEFELSGVNYIGYFNIRNNGNVFAGKFEDTEILTPIDNIKTEIYLDEKLYFDRTIEDKLILPFKVEDLLFAPNELINRNSLNSKIDKLYDNFKELYKFSIISIPKLPVNDTYFAAPSSNNKTLSTFFISWIQNSIDTSDLGNLIDYNNAFDDINESLNLFNSNLSAAATLFLSVSNTIFTYEVDKNEPGTNHTSFNFVASATNFGTFNELTFDRIANTTDDGDKVLFVADSIKNTIYKFDVSTIVNRDRTGQNKFKLLDSIGGTSLTGRQYNFSFNSLDKIEYSDDHLYTYDKGLYEIKKFTKEFTFKNVYKNLRYFKDNRVVSFKLNPYNKKLYVLSENFKFLIIDPVTFEVIDNFTVRPPNPGFNLLTKDFIFSTNDSNIFYILTSDGVYKGFVSRMKDNEKAYIAKLIITANVAFETLWEEYVNVPTDEWENVGQDWDEANEIIPASFANLSLDENFEKIYYITDRVFLELNENASYVSLTNDLLPFFSKKQTQIKDDFFNAFSLNSSLYKIVYNCNLLSSNINKFLKTSYYRQELTFDSFTNISPNIVDSTLLLDQNESFIGNNETVNIDVFNRSVNKILDYQNLLLSAYKVEIIGTKIPVLSTVPLL